MNQKPGFWDKILRFSINNTRILVVLSILWSALAIWIFTTLPLGLLPSLNFPALSVVVENQGLTAQELEKQVALPVESAMSGIYNVKRIRSTSVSNVAMVRVQLKWGADINLAREQVQQKLASLRGSLPQGSKISVETLSTTLGEVESFSLTGGKSLEALYDFAKYHLRPALLQQNGVFQVLIFGGLAPEYAVFLDPEKLEKYDLTIGAIRSAIAKNNVATVGGVLDLGTQSFGILPRTRMTNVKSIKDTIVAVYNDMPIRIRDIAQVRKSHLAYRGGAIQGDTPGVVIQIVRQPSANVVAVTHAIDEFFKHYKLPVGVKITKFYDQSEVVYAAVRGVEEAVVLGALLVALILLVFLKSPRASLVAFTSIPTSLLSSIVFMRYLHMSLNVMSLSALALATGMVIDDAIVVIENFFRHRELSPHDSISEVFRRAAGEVAGPVFSSTITTVAIFVPLIFLTGLAGRLFSPVGVIVSIVMSASLVFAFTLIPSVGPHLIKGHPPKPHVSGLTELYSKILHWALKRGWQIALVVFILCSGSLWVLTRLNRRFLPLLDEGSILMNVDGPPSNSLHETMRTVELLIHHVLYAHDIRTIVATIGHAPGAQDTDTMSHSDVVARLVPPHDRTKTIQQLFKIFRKRAKNFPGVSVEFTMPLRDKINDAIGGVPAAIGVKIFGNSLKTLEHLANEVAAKMVHIPGVQDLQPSSMVPVPSLQIALREKQADELGVTRADLNDAVQAMSYGVEATKVQKLYSEVPLMLRFEGTDDHIPTLHLNELKNVPIQTADGRYVPLSQVARLKFVDVPSRIEHEHAMRYVTVSCNVSGASTQSVVAKIKQMLAQLHLPNGYYYRLGGSYAAQSEATSGVSSVFFVAIFLVAVILWMEFQSIKETLLVLLTIPLSTIGASLALWMFHQTLNISSLIGLVMLVGLVLRNGIVLVDYIHKEVFEKGAPLHLAIVQGAKIRLRPILMTALSETLGLLPLALGIGSGSALEKPLAIAVIGGLVTSTFLTLFVLPIGYELLFHSRNKSPVAD